MKATSECPMVVCIPVSFELYSTYSRWKITARCHAVPDFVQVIAKVAIEHLNGLLVYTRTAVFSAYFQVAVVHHLLTYCK